jgi:phosphatidylinositol dimannoside acyltransferase
MIARHLARALGDSAPAPDSRRMGRLVDRAVASYARYWAESLRIPGMRAAELTAGITYDDFGSIAAGRAAGRGTILVLPHVGGWEWAGAQLAAVGHPVSVVVETLEPAELFEWFVEFRRQLGMNVIPAGHGAGSACAKALAENHILCLLSDRLIAGTAGVEVQFFGEPTLLPAGPATLAIRTGAALVPAAVYFEPRTDRHWAWVRPALDTSRHGSLRQDVHRVTQEMATIFEAYIQRDPTQWHLMQPNWPSDGLPEPPPVTEPPPATEQPPATERPPATGEPANLQ